MDLIKFFHEKTNNSNAENALTVLRLAITEDRIPELLDKFYIEIMKFAKIQRNLIKLHDIEAFNYNLGNELFMQIVHQAREIYNTLSESEQSKLWVKFENLISYTVKIHL